MTPLSWDLQASFNFGVPYKASLPHTPDSICQLLALALMAPNHYKGWTARGVGAWGGQGAVLYGCFHLRTGAERRRLPGSPSPFDCW